MDTGAMEDYKEWLDGLSDDEFENERYTVVHEWQQIGMERAEAEDKQAACDVQAHKRSVS